MVEILKPAEEYTFAEQLDLADECGVCLDDDHPTLNDIFQAWRHNVIADRSLMIYVDLEGELFLRVNGCTSKNNPYNPPVPSHVGRQIWLWFIDAWVDIVDELGDDIDCFLMPEDSDGYFDRRVENFKLMGFELVNSNTMRYKGM
jgi:hypothetical protein